eukprot:1765579-Pleurochrysis_carterae.AAC.1
MAFARSHGFRALTWLSRAHMTFARSYDFRALTWLSRAHMAFARSPEAHIPFTAVDVAAAVDVARGDEVVHLRRNQTHTQHGQPVLPAPASCQ